MNKQLRHDYFPPDSFGRAVQDELGDDVMLRLRQTLGGKDLRIPRARWTLLDDHWLVQAVGRETAERIAFLFDGERVYIPALPEAVTVEDEYVALAKSGLNNHEIADRMGVTDRQVRRRLAAAGMTNPNRKQSERQILTLQMKATDAAFAHPIAAE